MKLVVCRGYQDVEDVLVDVIHTLDPVVYTKELPHTTSEKVICTLNNGVPSEIDALMVILTLITCSSIVLTPLLYAWSTYKGLQMLSLIHI